MGHSTNPDPPAPPEPEWGPARGPRLAMGELVARSGVPAASIHHYRRLGLLPEPARLSANRFQYDGRHLEGLALVRLLRERSQMPLGQIRAVLPSLIADHDDQAFRSEMWNEAVDALLVDRPVGADVESKLVDVAIEAFGEAGYAEVTVSELCDRAGIAKGTFYRHHDTKGDLFLAAAQTVVDRAADDFAAAVGHRPLGCVEQGAVLAELLRPGLPLLLELAKRSLQREPGREVAARDIFGDLAERLGMAVGDGPGADGVGGALVMDAVVRIFSSSVMDDAAPTS